MKRIVLFISSLQKGGSERVMVNLAEYFHRKRYDVILVTQYRLEEEYPISPEIRRVYSEPDESALQGGRIRNFCVRFGALREIWSAYKPDVILSFLGKNNLMAVATAAFLPSKVAVSVRGEPTMEYEGRLMQMIARFVFRFADGVVLQTEGARAFFPKAVQKKSVILSNPLNEQFLNKRICEEREDLIVAAGRLDENKNHAMLIHAFAKIAEEYPAVKLVIYGEGTLRTVLEALVEEKGLGGRISLPGSVSDVADHICKARIFTLTSNTEGMPNSIMEAMALGIPVIATDCPCGGPSALIEDGVNGLLVPVGDAFALADAFRRIFEDREFELRLRENARGITQKLSPDRVDGEWEAYLNTL
ncbi:MAG: glycosyltransferase family 4 protein [Lachnospiraceae bacterium]|jgi:GalNAc-alpha-(1->4)-GalNAc-alpha-(1->3)-diNAcBac-PP-undecaprenol alpha-1,4-N-acetyl-D-galactosaminyltransferase|nr:glycosyltransferase family 4 protein [Lachnospiraceae bacterium]MDE6919239.1 glycosyltransferase [Lachnospiraceae bacterium]MDE6992049.1 glycosyltransferase [Lachnospiraceae bacterium]